MPANVVETEEYPDAVQGPAGGDPRTATSVRNMGSPLAKRTLWIKNRLYELIGSYTKKIASVSIAGDSINVVAHGLADDDPIGFRAIGVGASLPAALNGILAYAKVVDADNLQVAATPGGAAIDITDTGGGDRYVVKLTDGTQAIIGFAAGTIPMGTLKSQLVHLRDNYARKAFDNFWGALQTFRRGIKFDNNGTTTSSFIEYRFAALTDVDQDVQPTTDEFVFAVPTGDRIFTVLNTTPPPQEGARLRFTRPKDGAFSITIRRAGPLTIAVLPASKGTSVEIIYRGGLWRGSLPGDGVTHGDGW